MTGGKIGNGGASSRAGRPGRAPSAGERYFRATLCGAMVALIAAAFWIVLGLEELTSRGTIGLPALLDTRANDAPGCTSFAIDRTSGAAAASPCHGEILALSRPRAGDGDRF